MNGKMLAGVCSLVILVGCTKTLDDQLQASLPKICAALNVAHATFVTAAAAGTIRESIVVREQAAMAGVDQICADPSAVTDVATAAQAAARAYTAVVQSLRDAGVIGGT